MAEPASAGRTGPLHPHSLTEALGWVGHKLDEISGATVGKVEEILVDAEDSSPSWLLVKVGRFGRRTVVPFEFAAAGVGHVWVPYSKEAIRSAPEVKPATGLDAARELELCEHYGIPADSERSLALAGREESESSEESEESESASAAAGGGD